MDAIKFKVSHESHELSCKAESLVGDSTTFYVTDMKLACVIKRDFNVAMLFLQLNLCGLLVWQTGLPIDNNIAFSVPDPCLQTSACTFDFSIRVDTSYGVDKVLFLLSSVFHKNTELKNHTLSICIT